MAHRVSSDAKHTLLCSGDLSVPAKRGSGVSQRGKKDRHDGRPIKYNNVEKQRAGTEAEDVGAGSPTCSMYSCGLLHHNFHGLVAYFDDGDFSVFESR